MLTTASSNEGHAMSPQPPPRRRRHRTAKAVLTATALTTPLLMAFPAHAAPCRVVGGDLSCVPTHTENGSSDGGGGTGESSGSSGSVLPPPHEGLTDDQATGFVPVDAGTPAPAAAAPTTWELVQRAMDATAFPVPRVHTAPNGKTYVRTETVLWVDGFQVVRTQPISAGDQTVQATATPVSVTWSLGEKQLVCEDGGGQNSESCTYTYQRSSAGQPGGSYKITATITWDVTWTCEGSDCDAAGGDLGQQSMASVPTPLIVSEIQTNTGH
ncbi:hypothetical protein H4W34_004063 [Actinomadura algeriensis]|uniref:Ig-like domain-containing protein n=1 Tax=Actinomadura algeriensis TaxID=1679523 RepID=A0ABR9JUJ6_9ACTN|nr:hypothetical protein [Actinomadura algeriensis]